MGHPTVAIRGLKPGLPYPTLAGGEWIQTLVSPWRVARLAASAANGKHACLEASDRCLETLLQVGGPSPHLPTGGPHTTAHHGSPRTMPAPDGSTPQKERGPFGTRESARQSDQPYRLLFDANPHPMWVLSRPANACSTSTQPPSRAAYGYPREALLPLTILDIWRTPQDLRARPAQIYQDPIGSSGLCLTARWKHTLSDGSLIDVEITSSDLLWKGRPAHLVVVNEVTEPRSCETGCARCCRPPGIGWWASRPTQQHALLLTELNMPGMGG